MVYTFAFSFQRGVFGIFNFHKLTDTLPRLLLFYFCCLSTAAFCMISRNHCTWPTRSASKQLLRKRLYHTGIRGDGTLPEKFICTIFNQLKHTYRHLRSTVHSR
jgi:hypothetical protein